MFYPSKAMVPWQVITDGFGVHRIAPLPFAARIVGDYPNNQSSTWLLLHGSQSHVRYSGVD